MNRLINGSIARLVVYTLSLSLPLKLDQTFSFSGDICFPYSQVLFSRWAVESFLCHSKRNNLSRTFTASKWSGRSSDPVRAPFIRGLVCKLAHSPGHCPCCRALHLGDTQRIQWPVCSGKAIRTRRRLISFPFLCLTVCESLSLATLLIHPWRKVTYPRGYFHYKWKKPDPLQMLITVKEKTWRQPNWLS